MPGDFNARDAADLDPAVLRGFLESAGVFVGREAVDWSLLAGGRSNLTYMLNAGGCEFVLRRPPLGHSDPRAHDMSREFRMLQTLHPLGLPVPQPIVFCDDPRLIGACFYVMKRVAGRVVRSTQAAFDLLSAPVLRELADTVVDGLIELHGVDPQAAGLGDMGRPQGFAARQVKRWTQGWTERQMRKIPALDEAGRRLVAGMNAGLPLDADSPTIVHGDYNIGNLLVTNDGPPRLVAILDWEMSALGHPLMDLGILLTYNQFMNKIYGIADAIAAHPAYPSNDYFAQRYARGSARSIDMLDYFRALAFFKILVLIEDTRSRYLAGTTRGDGYDQIGTDTIENADALLDLLDKSDIPQLRG